jgi:hypothetical protein
MPTAKNGYAQEPDSAQASTNVYLDHVESGRRLLKVKTWKRSFASGRPVRTR